MSSPGSRSKNCSGGGHATTATAFTHRRGSGNGKCSVAVVDSPSLRIQDASSSTSASEWSLSPPTWWPWLQEWPDCGSPWPFHLLSAFSSRTGGGGDGGGGGSIVTWLVLILALILALLAVDLQSLYGQLCSLVMPLAALMSGYLLLALGFRTTWTTTGIYLTFCGSVVGELTGFFLSTALLSDTFFAADGHFQHHQVRLLLIIIRSSLFFRF